MTGIFFIFFKVHYNFIFFIEMESEAFHYYSLAFCIFQYFLPVLLMTYFYWMVASTIWKRHSDGPQTENLRNNTRDLNMLNGRKRVREYLTIFSFFRPII